MRKLADRQQSEARASVRPLVVVSGTAHWASRRLAEHHMARHLARFARVLFVDPPVSRLTLRDRPELRRQLEGPRLRQVADEIHLLTPWVLPGKDRYIVRDLTDRQTRRAIGKAVAALGGPVAATILTLPQRQLFHAGTPGVRIYWAKDDHVAGARLYGLNERAIVRSERRLVQQADEFLVCSDALAATWRDRGASPKVMMNGCEYDLFAGAQSLAVPDELRPADPPYAIYAGTLTSRIDETYLLAVAERGVRIVLVGAPRRTTTWAGFERLVEHERIQHVGAVDYEHLPAYLGNATVGLIPYVLDEYNRGSFPLKLFEYLASGLPVVSTDLPALSQVETGSCVRRGSTPSEFADHVIALMDANASSSTTEQCQRIAASHDWSQRAEWLADRVGLRA